ncbi:Aliphatic sulfonates family ABC transporter periplasmic ligand-binding protein [Pandoraea communis]|uniref:Putative aliphatic sulfonates-binding protein n=1 Tax=Pandoraea communis TaxID=2508297 RepID=A0A5E4YIB1_9BURK|nr:aliphatic sulfonate ABC transporter substrate-binding protein [Pandoraea communis]VVE48451.1 Aliphatic sulfonates family ABC transporter periplasmic ligand-binding protein [Pandoraea communis]
MNFIFDVRRYFRRTGERFAVVAALAAMTLATMPAPASAQTRAGSVTLRIAYLKGTSDLTLAKAKGSLDKALAGQGVKVVWAGPFPAAAPAFEALNADAVDLTSGSSTSFVTSIAAGVPMAIFGYQPMTAHNEAIVVPQDSGIRSLADLAGKQVAVNKGGTGEYLLVRALVKSGIAPDTVRRRYLSPSDTGSAFVGGGVDAWATWDPFLSIAKSNYHARVLADGVAIGSDNAVGYFVRQDYLKAHPEVVRTVLRVLRDENIWTAAHPREAGKIWAAELNLPPALADKLGENNVSPLRAVLPDDATRIERVARWYVDNRIIATQPDVRAHIATLAD